MLYDTVNFSEFFPSYVVFSNCLVPIILKSVCYNITLLIGVPRASFIFGIRTSALVTYLVSIFIMNILNFVNLLLIV